MTINGYTRTFVLIQPNSSVEGNTSNGTYMETDPDMWDDILTLVLKSCAMIIIMFAAVFGNTLVIVSVFRHHKLRITTNYFIVSLAFADTLVALLAMTFNASVKIAGRWVFDPITCDFWNSCDVLFSTASIMHLCCISVDRYYAIIKPLEYPNKLTGRTVAIMLICVWISSALISFIPIFLGWYTTADHLKFKESHPEDCSFVVNKPYAIISSSVSFWIPCFIMLFTYWKIFLEASKQEKTLLKSQSGLYHRPSADHTAIGGVNSASQHRYSHCDDTESGHFTPTKRHLIKLKREHKAAKTLGVIMGAFILCWLPFFLWYVSITMCGDACYCPDIVVDVLFWIGYFNSSLNPIIYAYFNRDFREAFKQTLLSMFCACRRISLQDNHRRESTNVPCNCSYRATQDIGLVENKSFRD
ncbi:octopamine receptor beta-2R-like [Limulus polyphemus]|uniref:Octopamine receptor beta-2R-like n=1 Tax=Limulus polyphemus TaxID=6850 RepID=A0ABM1B0X1_LIMPO|nr:octopamine receptor beta-2R-like [Limulus polyphemus]XP_022239352.1 octopamine receptor beta-2R-like [Limulus polyphemus]